jgi:hypothetical protein
MPSVSVVKMLERARSGIRISLLRARLQLTLTGWEKSTMR